MSDVLPGNEAIDALTAESAPNTAYVREGAFAALAFRNFRLLWTGALVSNAGTWLQTVAQGWLVLELTNSSFRLGLLNAVGTLPVMTLSLYGGVLADQVDRRKLLILSQSAQMLLTATMAVLTALHLISFNWLLVLVLGIGIASALSSPAWQAFVSELVPERVLLNAIALNSAQFNVARVIGPALAGTLIAAVGVAGCFGLNAASFLAVIASLLLLRLPVREQWTRRPDPWRSLVEGLRYVAGHTEARAIMLLATIHTVFGMPFLMLMPVFARDVFHGGAGALGTLLAGMGVGAVCGALVTARLGGAQRRGLLILGTEICFAISLLVFAHMPSLMVALPALAVVGFWMVSFFAIANTALQILSGEELRGRVMALWTIASWGIGPIGSLWAGFVAARFGADQAVTLGALICLAAAVIMALGSPLLRML